MVFREEDYFERRRFAGVTFKVRLVKEDDFSGEKKNKNKKGWESVTK